MYKAKRSFILFYTFSCNPMRTRNRTAYYLIPWTVNLPGSVRSSRWDSSAIGQGPVSLWNYNDSIKDKIDGIIFHSWSRNSSRGPSPEFRVSQPSMIIYIIKKVSKYTNEFFFESESAAYPAPQTSHTRWSAPWRQWSGAPFAPLELVH